MQLRSTESSETRSATSPSRISVVIACHNYGRFLTDAVESVLAQSRPADEIVIVDDGSTDDTTAVIARLGERVPDLIVVSRFPARGAATTFNDAIATSSGDAFVLLSADDRLSPTYLEETARALDDPQIAFAYADELLFGAVDEFRRAPEFSFETVVRDKRINGSPLMRRTWFDRTGGYRSDVIYEDWELYINLMGLGALGRRASDCWLEYRRHEQGSRNSMGYGRAIRATLQVWRLHPRTVRLRDLAVWFTRKLWRYLPRPGATRPTRI